MAHLGLFLLIGASFGVVARAMTHSRGGGYVINILIGAFGAATGGDLAFDAFDISTYGLGVAVVMSVLGAAMFLMVFHIIVDKPRFYDTRPGPKNQAL